MVPLPVADVTIVVASLATFALYQRKIAKAELDPTLAPAFVDEARRQWITSVIEGQRDILAVQTLRNMLMAASFFASTAFFAAVGLLSFGMTSGGIPAVFERLNILGHPSPAFFTGKLLLLVLVLFGTFFTFALAIRYYNHVGLVLNVPVREGEDIAARAGALLRRGALHYSWGMRGYYYAIPLALWLFGPLWMGLGTLLVLPLLRRHDHLPT